jgi:GDP-L-fucose synthase
LKILIAGSTGLVGSATYDHLANKGYDVTGLSSKTLDLTKRDLTIAWFRDNKFDVVIDSAARVGGIMANQLNPVEFLSQNLTIQNNLMEASFESKVKRFIFLGSSCIYPRDARQPIREEELLTGKLEPTNSAYAIAKIAGLEMVKAYRAEYGLPWISLMPTNIYGPKDNFGLSTSHVLPALIRKISDAKFLNKNEVTLWGSGAPMREFLYSQDLASAILFALREYDEENHLNVGTGHEISIFELAKLIAKLLDFKGEIIWDKSKPDGSPRKLLDSSRIHSMGWRSSVSLSQGLENTVKWYLQEKDKGMIRL